MQALHWGAMNARRIPSIFSPRRRSALTARSRGLQRRENAARYLFEDMEEDVLDRLGFMRFKPARALIVGTTTGALNAHRKGAGTEVTERQADRLDEEAPYPLAPFDFIASFGTLATVNDLPGALIHIRNALEPGGLAMISFLGAGSLPALREAVLSADNDRPAARMHPQVDTRAAAALMQRAGFTRQVVDSRTLQVRYRSLDRLVADLRDQGLTNVLASSPPPVTRGWCERARQAFEGQVDDNGRVTERIEILTLTGWKA